MRALLAMVLFMVIGRSQFGCAALARTKSLTPRSIGYMARIAMASSNAQYSHKRGTARRSSSTDINTLNKIILQPEEQELFEMFTTMIEEKNLGTTVRIAGGWVRDKLLGVRGKEDIDVALDNLSGVEFAQALSEWNESRGGSGIKFGVIQQNPDKSKHLETATATLGKYQIDFVNLRTEEYTDSRIPKIEIGTPQEDADRRDLTINSLFYNVNREEVEDFTGRGLADLATGLAKTPLEALTTLKDDPLRALRAVRFSCRFDLTMAPDLASACQDADVHTALRDKVSRERIFVETEQMMQHETGAPRAMLMLHSLDLTKHVLSLDPTDTEIGAVQAQEYFSPLYDPTGAGVMLPCEEESLQAISVEDIKVSYHTYGTCVAAALAMYQLSLASGVGTEKGEDAASLRGLCNFAALTLRGSTMSCLKPVKQGRVQGGSRPKQFFNSLVLQRLKMRVKDIETIQAMHDAALELTPMLRRLIAYEGGDVYDVSPLSYKGITRLELGLVLRNAGIVTEHALNLAVAALVVETLQHASTGHMAEMLPLLSQNTFGETDVFLCGFRGHRDGNSPDTPLQRLLGSLSGTAGKGGACESIKAIEDAAASFRDAVMVMGLEQVHKDTPLINGKDIKKVCSPEDTQQLFILNTRYNIITTNLFLLVISTLPSFFVLFGF